MSWTTYRRLTVALGIASLAIVLVPYGQAQRKKSPPVSTDVPRSAVEVIRKQQQGAKESVEADVSARTIGVGANFSGVEFVVLGAIDNTQQPSPESGYYDVIVVVEGVPSRLVVRRKSNVAGLWINTSSADLALALTAPCCLLTWVVASDWDSDRGRRRFGLQPSHIHDVFTHAAYWQV